MYYRRQIRTGVFRMRMNSRWINSVVFIGCAFTTVLFADTPTTQKATDLSAFRTVETAIPAKPRTATPASHLTGYLGVTVKQDSNLIVIDHVDPASPAATAGLLVGDVIISAGTEAISRPEVLREFLLSHSAGDSVNLSIRRGTKTNLMPVVLSSVSRPMKAAGERAMMGVQFRDTDAGEGAVVQSVQTDMPADRAGMRAGDIIVKLDGIAVAARQAVMDALAGRSPNEEVKVTIKRGGELREMSVKLVADRNPRALQAALERGPGLYKKNVYKLAIIGVEFPDLKHNSKITSGDWEQSFFSSGSYSKLSATSQPTFGSINDYYKEVSCGAFHLEGEMFDWVEVSHKRAEYAPGTGDTLRMLPEALDKLVAREGKNALEDFDGVAFIYAGERVQTSRGGLFWPHKGLVAHNGKRWNYLIVNEGGSRMTNISVFTHEFGHMLGLPDLYARPENPGSEGLGVWCLMSQQITDGRPQHMSAWCKEQLGWLKPTTIDPAIPQKLVLSPIEGSTRECFKIPVKSDSSEYYLLENRRKTGYDTELPGEGLLIWRVVGGKPFLIESHGIEGPIGVRSFPALVPFPSQSNRAFTPYTTPSSHSLLGGGSPVFITEIERRPDGKITFAVGYETF